MTFWILFSIGYVVGLLLTVAGLLAAKADAPEDCFGLLLIFPFLLTFYIAWWEITI